MLAKRAALLQSKIGIALAGAVLAGAVLVGAVLVAGGGAAVATGVTSHLPLASFAQNGAHSGDNATKTTRIQKPPSLARGRR